MYKAVIFDLDGTLLDTLTDIATSANFVLKNYNKSPLPIEDYNLLVGQGAAQLFKDLLPELSLEEQKDALALFEQHYAKQFSINTNIYEGISKVLTFLQVRDIKMAVLSNKPNSFTKKCVIKYLKNWKFDAAYGIREGIPRKPDNAGVIEILKELGVSANETLFVGDTKVDMQTAKNADMDSIGVLWGFREKEELVDHGATFIAEEPADIIKLIMGKN
jgi:phosphoglycolate phosphatase